MEKKIKDDSWSKFNDLEEKIVNFFIARKSFFRKSGQKCPF